MAINDNTVYGLTGAQVKDLPVEMAAKVGAVVKTNAGAPTTSTEGTIGQLLEDTTNGKLYQLKSIATSGGDPVYTSSRPEVIWVTDQTTFYNWVYQNTQTAQEESPLTTTFVQDLWGWTLDNALGTYMTGSDNFSNIGLGYDNDALTPDEQDGIVTPVTITLTKETPVIYTYNWEEVTDIKYVDITVTGTSHVSSGYLDVNITGGGYTVISNALANGKHVVGRLVLSTGIANTPVYGGTYYFDMARLQSSAPATYHVTCMYRTNYDGWLVLSLDYYNGQLYFDTMATKSYVDGLVGNVASALNAINNGTSS